MFVEFLPKVLYSLEFQPLTTVGGMAVKIVFFYWKY